MANRSVSARLEVPEQALLLYENMVVGDPDRTGNWRFFIRQDGCFFNARNTQLWITEPSQFESDDPSLFWNTPFPATPDRCLTAQQLDELEAAIQSADPTALDANYAPSGARAGASRQIERWTMVTDQGTKTVSVENGAAPPQLAALRTTIDGLVAEAPPSPKP